MCLTPPQGAPEVLSINTDRECVPLRMCNYYSIRDLQTFSIYFPSPTFFFGLFCVYAIIWHSNAESSRTRQQHYTVNTGTQKQMRGVCA